MRTAPSAGRIVCSLSGRRTVPSAGRTVCIGFAGIRTGPWAGRIGHNKKRGLFLAMREHRFPLARRTSGTVIAALDVIALLALEAN